MYIRSGVLKFADQSQDAAPFHCPLAIVDIYNRGRYISYMGMCKGYGGGSRGKFFQG